MFFYSCSEKTIPSTSAATATVTADTSFYPPYTWQEHWFDHRQLIKRVYFNNNVAVYFDDDVSREKTSWLFGLVDSIENRERRSSSCVAVTHAAPSAWRMEIERTVGRGAIEH